MSQENVEIVRRAYGALASRDWDAVFNDTHSDFAIETQLQGSHRGRDAAQSFIEDQIDTFEAWTAEPEEFFDGKDQVVVFVKVRAQPKGSDATIEIKTRPPVDHSRRLDLAAVHLPEAGRSPRSRRAAAVAQEVPLWTRSTTHRKRMSGRSFTATATHELCWSFQLGR